MVKLKGPGLATDAAGGLGEIITFSKSKGRSYAKKWSKPANPNTATQKSMRAILRFLSEEWRNIPSADQNLWLPLSQQTNVSPFNAFQTFNLTRWRSGLAPSQIPTPDTTGSFGNVTTPTATAVSRGVTFAFSATLPSTGWAALIYSVPNFGDPYAWQYFIHAIEYQSAGTFSWTWRPIAAGVYNFAITLSKVHGHIWTGRYNKTATVT